MGNQLAIVRMKPNRFKQNSIILITGASSGIGREIAIRYAQRKCKLVLAARNENKLKEVKDLCISLGASVEYIVCDVSIEENCKNIIEETVRLFGGLDILYLNAGVNAHAKFQEIEDLQIFKKIMDTNFYGYLYPTKYALPHLEKSKGQIVVLSSISGEMGLPFRTAYCSSKFAVTGFFESLRIELDNKEIAITLVCPPSVKTPMRDHDLLQKYSDKQVEEKDTRMSVEDAVDTIILAADTRSRKIYFPFKAYFAVYIRPFFPDFVGKFSIIKLFFQPYKDTKLKKDAKL